jgi:hypothetical protein
MATSTPAARGRIFVSYRRDDTAYPAAWLFDRLADRFGRDQVFKDIDSIQLGDDFVEVISAAVESCDVLLALIGDRWLTSTGEDGRRRIDNPDDFVRLEIEAALRRNVRVIPILVEGARMPRVGDLPPSLAMLARRQALELSPSQFEFDTERLIRVLDMTLTEIRAHTDTAPLERIPAERQDDRAAPGRQPSIPRQPGSPVDSSGVTPAGSAPPAGWAPPIPGQPAGGRQRDTTRTARPASPVPPADANGPTRASARRRMGWAWVSGTIIVGVGLVVLAITTLGSGGPPHNHLSTHSPSPSPRTSASASPSHTSAHTIRRTITGDWSGQNGPLTLVVTAVDRYGSILRLHLKATNDSAAAMMLPFYQNFQATDNMGHSYGAENIYGELIVPAGEFVTDVVTLAGAPPPSATSLDVSFAEVYGDDAPSGGITVTGVPLPK